MSAQGGPSALVNLATGAPEVESRKGFPDRLAGTWTKDDDEEWGGGGDHAGNGKGENEMYPGKGPHITQKIMKVFIQKAHVLRPWKTPDKWAPKK